MTTTIEEAERALREAWSDLNAALRRADDAPPGMRGKVTARAVALGAAREREALKRYVRHLGLCGFDPYGKHGGVAPCVCGLAELYGGEV